MKKLTTILFGLFLALSALAQNTNTTDTGVVINGVKWATRNVDAFGTFVDTPESTGMFYQWNRPKAWNTTDVEVTGWDATVPAGTIWEKANDPSPKGWRVPTKEEQQSLFDVEKVTNEWTTQNGITGRKFIDKATGNSLFLPAAGNRFYSPGALGYAGMRGYYWSSTPYETIGTGAYGLYFGEGNTYVDFANRSYGFCVRPVLAE